MENIILYGNTHDKTICNSICRALQAYSKSFIKQNDYTFNIITKDNKFLKLFECDKIPKIKNKSGILIFKNSFIKEKNVNIPNTFTSVISAQNTNAVSFLKNTNIVTITCGTSSKDTLSIASLDLLNATISLQRDIKTIYQSPIEAHEFLVELKKETGVYPLLSACTVLLLCGISANKYIF